MARRVQVPKSGAAPRKVAPKSNKAAGSTAVLWGILGAAVLIVVGLIVLQSQLLNRPATVSGQIGEGSAWGPANAKVRIVEYSDFGCSYCRQFAQSQSKQLRAEYEASGNVRFEFRHFIVGGTASEAAANAAECAADQGRFWDYHDVLFAQQGLSATPFSKTNLKQYAVQLGLDTAAFNRCVDSDQHLEGRVKASNNEARSLGVYATPTFFVNGQRVEGAVPYTQFKAVVDTALATAR